MLIKKIFVCEFITAGGFNDTDLPVGLVAEAELMRDALLRDLSDLHYLIHTTIDTRLNAPKKCQSCVAIEANDNAWSIWTDQMQQADAVWIIAPEANGMLLKLTELAMLLDRPILGCGVHSVKTTSEKLATYFMLQQAGIKTIPTYTLNNWPKTDGEKNNGKWLAKPNDGAGCDETVLFDDVDGLANWLEQNHKKESHVIQPYQKGIPASISCVMHQGQAQVLSCNRQMISIENNKLSFAGSQVNDMRDFWPEFELLAQKIALTDTDLTGYVGIDVIVNTQKDNEITVVEINPRLTTSYAGLAEATGENPAELIISTLTQPHFVWPVLQRNVVNIHV
ncbi:MAG: ATP-grasp domain-containing protein [Pseudomonadota bacterium]